MSDKCCKTNFEQCYCFFLIFILCFIIYLNYFKERIDICLITWYNISFSAGDFCCGILFAVESVFFW